MTRHPLFGVFLAAAGAIVLTPDALLMRLSGMNGLQMTAWRGWCMGGVFILGWLLTSRNRAADLVFLRKPMGQVIAVCQFFNSLFFCLAIAMAPVAIVLFGLATVPVIAAILAWLVLGEPAQKLTWVAIALVMAGICLAVSGGEGGETLSGGLSANVILGALLGLGVAFVLAMNFVVIRAEPDLPIMLLIGCGALVSGAVCTLLVGPGNMTTGNVLPMMVTGVFVLPAAFLMLSVASRYTHASNVSLLMLLETVLGPFWVWLVIGEQPTQRMIWGGIIVVVSLAGYILLTGRQTTRVKTLP